MVEDMGCAGREGKNNGRNQRICGGERCGERGNEIFGRSMDRKTKELKESCKCDTISLKRINVSCHKRTIISESESIMYSESCMDVKTAISNSKSEILQKKISDCNGDEKKLQNC